MRNAITAPRETIAWNLEAYGENELAEVLLNSSDEVLFQVWTDAFSIMASDTKRRMIDHYLARGAVKTLSGTDRPLKRKTRRFSKPEPKTPISQAQFEAWMIWQDQ